MKIVFRRSLSRILMLFYMLLFALALMLVVSGNGALVAMTPLITIQLLGVRGGTILGARGVVREDAAAFFGITFSLPVSDVAGLAPRPEPEA